MITHKATKITIVAEKLILDGIIAILDEVGATGYSYFEGSGKGSHGAHPHHRPAIVDAFAIVKIEAILTDRDHAEDAAEKISGTYFDSYSGIIYMDEVEVLRPSKF
jgi:nitrogen regulatory protein PII